MAEDGTDPAVPAVSYDLTGLLDVWESSLRTVIHLGRGLTPHQWETPTECPGWTVGDVMRHLCWVEAELAGRSDQPVAMDWAAHPHVSSDFGRRTETGVQIRRHLAQASVCDELEALLEIRLAMLLALEPLALETEVPGIFGKPVPLGSQLRIRSFDIWTHEQDVHRAAGLPGGLTSLGAQVSADQISASLPYVLARGLGAPAGTTMLVSVTGPLRFTRGVGVGEDGRGTSIPELSPDQATLTLTTDWETFARLSAGRLDVSDDALRSRVEVQHRSDVPGAAALAGRLLAALSITP